jgi:hypothetical protein
MPQTKHKFQPIANGSKDHNDELGLNPLQPSPLQFYLLVLPQTWYLLLLSILGFNS